MATATMPSKQVRTGGNRRRWIVVGVIVIIAAIVAGVLLTRTSSSSAKSVATTTVSNGSVVASVSGSGTIAANQTLDLSFTSSGTVAEVSVKEGDTVQAGQQLAKLDTRDLQLQVASAQAALESAQAKLGQTQTGNIKPQDVTAQQASVASAQAQLRSAQAQLAALTAPAADKLAAQESAVHQAELSLQSTKDSASATKTKAEQDLAKASEALTQAQSSYATAKSNWDYAQETGNNPVNPTTTNSKGKAVANKLSDGEQRQYYDTFIRAEAALRSAEQSVQQAQVTVDSAHQSEVTSIQQAEAKLADAQLTLQTLNNPANTDVAQKQASVDQARASVAQAQANLEKLTAPGTESDVAIQNASVSQAQQSLAQAQLKLSQATLTAPFGGIVTAVNVTVGGVTSGTAVSILNRDPLHIDLKLSENDVAKVSLGQTVDVTFDALKGVTKTGTVSYIAAAAESSNGVVTYKVQVDVPGDDTAVKVGMTANLSIITARKDSVLLVPTSALQPKGTGRVVQLVGADGKTSEVDVTIGLTDGTNTEVISGLKAGDKVVTAPSAKKTIGG